MALLASGAPVWVPDGGGWATAEVVQAAGEGVVVRLTPFGPPRTVEAAKCLPRGEDGQAAVPVRPCIQARALHAARRRPMLQPAAAQAPDARNERGVGRLTAAWPRCAGCKRWRRRRYSPGRRRC